MIGKTEWFTYRKFGWGISPKTWQGWVYVAIVALIFGGTVSAGINKGISVWIFGIVTGIVLLDILHIMTNLPKVHDERENYHQLVIERNCSFAAIGALIAIAFWQTYQRGLLMNSVINTIPFDYTLLIVLGAMFVTKVLSVVYVKWKM